MGDRVGRAGCGRKIKSAFAAFLCVLGTGVAAFPVERCMNLGGALEAPAEGDWGYIIEKQHLDRLATDGFDTIRLPVKFSQYWDGTAMDLALMARVDQVIGWATRAGLNVILDLHHFEELMQDPDAHSANFIAMWAYLSDYYVDHSDKLIFELLNEPTEALTTDKAVALYQKIIADLRVDHPTR